MNSRKAKQFLILLLITFLCACLTWMSFIYSQDLAFKYKEPKGSYSITSEIYQNSGIAKNFTYDSAILGSSMSENFKPSLFKQYYNSEPVKLTYAGAYMKNITFTLSQLFDSENDVKYIFLGLDDYMLTNEDSAGFRFDIPEWIYGDNLLDHVQYLFNKGVYISLNKEKTENPMENAYNWSTYFTYSKNQCIKDIKFSPSQKPLVKEFGEQDKIVIDKNLESLLDIISQNPDTTFEIFIPPYSMVWWYTMWVDNKIDYQMEVKKYAYPKLLAFDNVKLTFLQDDINIVENLDNYKDTGHYSQNISDLIVKLMSDHSNILTLDNYDKTLDDWRTFTKSYDYESLFK